MDRTPPDPAGSPPPPVPTLFHHALLARARLDLGLTQDEAAAAAGIDVRTYRRYESGEVNDPALGFAVRHPSRRRILQRLAAELGLAEDELLVTAAGMAPASSPSPAPSAYAPVKMATPCCERRAE